jgi:hypothetical protein
VFHVASGIFRTIFARDDLVRLFSTEGIGEYWGRVVAGKKAAPFTYVLEAADWKVAFDPNADGDERG